MIVYFHIYSADHCMAPLFCVFAGNTLKTMFLHCVKMLACIKTAFQMLALDSDSLPTPGGLHRQTSTVDG